jgi:hypothetical protein
VSMIAAWRSSQGPNRHHRFQVITRIDTRPSSRTAARFVVTGSDDRQRPAVTGGRSVCGQP